MEGIQALRTRRSASLRKPARRDRSFARATRATPRPREREIALALDTTEDEDDDDEGEEARAQATGRMPVGRTGETPVPRQRRPETRNVNSAARLDRARFLRYRILHNEAGGSPQARREMQWRT